jgi:hypothetical protein
MLELNCQPAVFFKLSHNPATALFVLNKGISDLTTRSVKELKALVPYEPADKSDSAKPSTVYPAPKIDALNFEKFKLPVAGLRAAYKFYYKTNAAEDALLISLVKAFTPLKLNFIA